MLDPKSELASQCQQCLSALAMATSRIMVYDQLDRVENPLLYRRELQKIYAAIEEIEKHLSGYDGDEIPY